MDIKIRIANDVVEHDLEIKDATEDQVDALIQAFSKSVGAEVVVAKTLEPAQFIPCNCKAPAHHPIEQAFSETSAIVEAYKTFTESPAHLKPVSTESTPVHVEAPNFGTNMGDKLAQAFSKGFQAPEMVKVAEPTTTVKSAAVSNSYAEQQDFYKTGIKYKTIRGVENVPTYRCHWNCPNPMCNEKGNHYVTEGTETVYCFTCNTKIKVEDATAMGFPNRDDWGNFYVAHEEA